MVMADTKEVKKRNLDDLSKTASMDMVAVNNLIVSLRAPVKKSRVRVIHQLTKKARLLRSKKGGEDLTKKNAEKAERLLQEARTMNGLDVDKVAKFALSNTVTFDQLVQNQPDAPMTTRAMTRLASYKDLSDRVKQFRQDHDDWRELANFILYKNTGRRYRKNKTKRKEGEAVIRDMVVKNLGGDDGKKENDDDEGDESGDENEIDNDSESDGDSENGSDGKGSDASASNENIQEETRNVQKENDSSEEDGSRESDDSSDKCQKKRTKKIKDTKTKSDANVSSKATMANRLKTLVADLPSDSSNDEEEQSFAPDRLAKRLLGIPDSNASSSTSSDKNESSSKNDDDGSSDSEPAKPKIQGEMVVAKLNMNEDIDKTFAKIQNSTFGDERTKHKPKSSFFLGGESDSEPEEDDDDVNVDAQIKSEKDLSEEQTNRGREMVESIFIADLSGKGGHSGGRGRGGPRGHGAPSWRGGRGGPPGRGGSRGRGEPVQAFGRGRGGDRGGHQRGHGMFGHRGTDRSHGFEQRQGPAKPDKVPEKDSGPLHPSWEASRKRKEASSIQAFTGKKIKFDDD